MKTEVEIREWLNQPINWSSEYMKEDELIPVGVALWFIRNCLAKHFLEDIPDNIVGYYCRTHQRAFLAENGKPTGCDLCKKEEGRKLRQELPNV